MVVSGSLNAFCVFGLLNWLPIYLTRATAVEFAQLRWPLALVFAAGIAGIGLMADLGDQLQQRTWLTGMGFLLAGGMVYAATTTLRTGVCAYAAQEYALV